MSATESGIQVSGRGRASAVPDVMVLDTGVEAMAQNPSAAFAAARAGLVRVRESALAAGVAPEDLQTSAVSLHPNYDRDGAINGHVGSLGVTIKVRDIAAGGAVIDAITSAATDVARINGIRLEHSDPTALQQEARASAVADARARAQELADLVGRRLGACAWISEGGSPGPRPMAALRAEAAGDQMIDPGQVEIGVTVATVWEFAD